MSDYEIRLECLKLANTISSNSREIEKIARQYADFILGTKDAEIIRAARELSKKVQGGE
ncbi:hypothetical protein [Kiloniella antarctica]|uniref:Uncharacterized protein n=1 Tax=Kiloniella antarctica TaxID=1550907 RepID=A0ABW5BM04_9PROT